MTGIKMVTIRRSAVLMAIIGTMSSMTQAQGFLLFVGSIGALLYNCSLCTYYLIVITYKKGRDADICIRERIGIYLHAVPICVSVIGGITTLYLDAFHPQLTYCFIGPNPDCQNEEECEKRAQDAKLLYLIMSTLLSTSSRLLSS